MNQNELKNTQAEFVPASSDRPRTGKVKWIRPTSWTNNPLYFEIFQLASSGNWKVSLIATRNQNEHRLSQLRTAASFLKDEFGWKLPIGYTENFKDRQSEAVFVYNCGLQEDPISAIQQAEDVIRETLDNPRWKGVLDVQ